MLKELALVWVAVAVSIVVAAFVVPSIDLEGGVLAVLGVAVLFGLVNALVGPLLRLGALPLTIMTFGPFTIVVHGGLLGVPAGVSGAADGGGPLRGVLGG